MLLEVILEVAAIHRAHRLDHARRIGCVIALHGSRIRAEWRMYDRIDGEMRDRGPRPDRCLNSSVETISSAETITRFDASAHS